MVSDEEILKSANATIKEIYTGVSKMNGYVADKTDFAIEKLNDTLIFEEFFSDLINESNNANKYKEFLAAFILDLIELNYGKITMEEISKQIHEYENSPYIPVLNIDEEIQDEEQYEDAIFNDEDFEYQPPDFEVTNNSDIINIEDFVYDDNIDTEQIIKQQIIIPAHKIDVQQERQKKKFSLFKKK